MMNRLFPVIFALFPFLSVMGSYSASSEKNCPTPIKQDHSCFSIEDRLKKNWDIFADLLFWHMGEVGTIPNSTIAVTSNQYLISELNINNLNFHWDLGYRIGGRYSNIGHNQWGFSLYYTWYRTEAKNKGTYDGFVGIPSGFPLTGTLSDADFLNLFWLFAAQSYNARWDLLYNIFDFQLDHEYLVSKAISLKPYLGLRGGWIHQNIHIHSTYLDTLANNTPVPAKEKLKNHFWGIGPSCGLDSEWCLGQVGGHSFYLFDNFSGAFLWSFWSYSDQLSIGNNINGDLKAKHRQAGSLMFQDVLGFQWSVKLNKNGSLFSLRLGFEFQYWFDHLQIFNTYNGRQHNALTLQGGTFDLRFDY